MICVSAQYIKSCFRDEKSKTEQLKNERTYQLIELLYITTIYGHL